MAETEIAGQKQKEEWGQELSEIAEGMEPDQIAKEQVNQNPVHCANFSGEYIKNQRHQYNRTGSGRVAIPGGLEQ